MPTFSFQKQLLLLLLTVTLLTPSAPLWAASSGANSPGSTANDTSVGTTAWTDHANVAASDDSYAGFNSIGTSNYLKATNFSFNIPVSATIDGIEVNVERIACLSDIRDSSIRLVQGGVISGDNKAVTGSDWSTSEVTATYGSSSDPWGLTWTPDDINSATFGTVVSVSYTGVVGCFDSPVARIDHITITVHYTEPVPTPAAVTASAPVSDDSPHDPAAGLTSISLDQSSQSQTRSAGSLSGSDASTTTVTVKNGGSFTLSTKPPNADQLQRLYLRVNGQEYEFKDVTTDPNNPLFTVSLTLPPGSYPYTLTADYGITTLSEQGTLHITRSLQDPLMQSINALFRQVNDRNPTSQEWHYWAHRVSQNEKTSLPELLGAIEYQALVEA